MAHPRAFQEILDWIEAGENGCRGYFFTWPQHYLYLEPYGVIDFHFECPATAMMVKVRWA
ncbi:MAG: hypothetical protein EOO77_22840 [Oxalobacteraceae bacterium]|nr:MAG: hypothetical protein EOO77_22840 [Oxalobacteraceae bacterium]